MENDADTGALAEWKFGAGKGCQNMIFLTFGTGLAVEAKSLGMDKTAFVRMAEEQFGGEKTV